MTTSPSSSWSDHSFLEELRRRRAELRDSISALELALAAPRGGGRTHWVERVRVALVELSADLGVHVQLTEGPAGLYADIRGADPRLSEAVDRLTDEHGVLKEQVRTLIDRLTPPDTTEEVDDVRRLGTALLGTLVRHRQRGADLVYEAYEFDIGGDT